MSMKNVPWADEEELRNERPRLRPDMPFGQYPPPPDMQGPMGRGFSGDMGQLQSNADANADPRLGSPIQPLGGSGESPLVAKARELREKAMLAESIGDSAVARAQKRPVGVTDKVYRQLEQNAKKEADPKLGSPLSSKGGFEFDSDAELERRMGEGPSEKQVLDWAEKNGNQPGENAYGSDPTDAELEKRMGEGPKDKDVEKWGREYGGRAKAAAKGKKKPEDSARKRHLDDVAAMLARLKARRGTKDDEDRGPGPWADQFVTSDERAKREAYELGRQHGGETVEQMPKTGVHVAGRTAPAPDERFLYKADGSRVQLGGGEQKYKYSADGTSTPLPSEPGPAPAYSEQPFDPQAEKQAQWEKDMREVKGRRLGDLTREDFPGTPEEQRRVGVIAKNMVLPQKDVLLNATGAKMAERVLARIRGKK